MVRVGQRVGRIRIQALLGEGGMGSVYQGFDETLGRQVALKTIRAGELAGDGKARFLREARVLSQLEHPNICRIFDYVESDEGDYLVLELIRGRTLSAAISEGGLGRDRKLAIALDLAKVLVSAHAEGVIHRDLKPGNVMLCDDGGLKVLDFGLARPVDVQSDGIRGEAGAERALAVLRENDPTIPLDDHRDSEAEVTTSPAGAPRSGSSTDLRAGVETRLGRVMGTPAYMSPEQARGESVGAPSDMFSFGLLLFTLWTGRRPYGDGIGSAESLRRAAECEVQPIVGVDRDVAALIASLVEAAPTRRPTAMEAVAKLESIAGRGRRRARRAVAALAVVVAGAGVAKYTVDLRRERNIADLRRGQAEDLLGFMLGDLEDKLEPLGRLDILREIGEQASQYYRSVPAEELSTNEIFRRSQAMIQIAEIEFREGDLDASLRTRQEVLELAEDLLRRDPGSVEWRTRLGASHFWIGRLHWEKGELDAALERFERQHEIAKALAEEHPEDPDLQLEFAHSRTNIGFIEQARGDLGSALDAFRSVIHTLEEVLVLRPDDSEVRFEYATQTALVGTLLWQLGEPGAAMRHYLTGHEILEQLVEQDPDNGSWRYQIVVSHNVIGAAALAAGDGDSAGHHFGSALAEAERLIAIEPGQALWQRAVGESSCNLARRHLGAGDPGAAIEPARRAVARFESLAARTTTPALESLLASGRVVLARALAAIGSSEEAREQMHEGLVVLERQAAESPGDRASQRRLAEGLLAQGYLQGGDAARRDWQRVAEIVQPIAEESRDLDFVDLWVEALESLARDQEAERQRIAQRALRRETLGTLSGSGNRESG